jgi:thiamine phosphate synthase YjbQ (UPF0047 family)
VERISWQKDARASGRVEMKSYRKELWFQVPSRRAFVNIFSQAEDCRKESGIKEGWALIKTKHI